MRTALVIIAQEGYQDREFEATRDALQGAGFEVSIASVEAGLCKGKLNGSERADVALKDVNVAAFDRVAFIGGPGAHLLIAEPEALRIARDTVQAGKILGAICIAPTILAEAGVLRGKRATAWNEDGLQEPFLRAHGAVFTDEEVTVDGRLVTGNGPLAAPAFGKAFAEA